MCLQASIAHKVNVAPLPPFDPASDPNSLGQRWKTWKRRFETFLVAVNDKQKPALLLYQAGQDTQELFDTLTDTGEDYATAIRKLDAYSTPKKNVDFETFQFRQAAQQDGETVDQFVARHRN